MKKLIAQMLLSVAACSALGSPAAAVEDGSLLNQNSFGLYYREDSFDLTLNPAFVSEIDRWRLFTNLSNYEEADSYLFGTSGRLGPGSLGLFYETSEERMEEESSRSSDLTTNLPASLGSADVSSRRALTTAQSESARFEDESDRHGFIVTYGMDFGGLTLGASYRPSFSQGGTTLIGSIGDHPNYGSDPLWWDRRDFTADLRVGRNYARTWRETLYGRDNPDAFRDESESEAFEGRADTDEDRHALELGSQLRLWKSLPVWVRLGAQSMKRTGSGSGSYSFSRSETRRGNDDTLWPDDGYTESESRTSTWSGNPVGGPDSYPFDGTEWSLEIVPRHIVSDHVAVELQLGYRAAQGEVTGRWTQDIAIDRSLKLSATERTDSWQGSQQISSSFSGESDASGYSLAPRVYLAYGSVEFALGIDYAHSRDEVTGTQQAAGAMTWSYDDGSGVADAGDWRYAGSSTSRSERSLEFTATVVSFPVATRFKVTDKLELRAGAEFVRTDRETELGSSTREDEQFAITDGTGNVVRQGPGTRGTEEAEREEATASTTHYRLGAGYRATENLQFDVLFSQSRGGGVDTNVVHASVVFAF